MYVYSHGGNASFERGREDIIDLSASINPLGMPGTVRDAIIREIPNCGSYPDSFSRKLREKIAVFEDVQPDWIFCGNGASDIIFRIPRAINAKRVMLSAPTFSDYERSAKAFGADIIRYPLSPETGFDLGGGFIEAVYGSKPDLVFVCNPNNPTGKLVKLGLIKELLECCKQIGAYAIVDECFLDFAEQSQERSGKIFLERYPNLVILKAFTKLFALPGIRLGYAICSDEELIQRLYSHGAEWPVSNLAQAAGIAALEDAERFVKETVAYVSAERMAMEKELSRLGYKIFEAAANYMFLQNPYPFDLREELDKKGIRIRSCGNYHGLDGSYYRIAVSTPENNKKLLFCISEVTNQ